LQCFKLVAILGKLQADGRQLGAGRKQQGSTQGKTETKHCGKVVQDKLNEQLEQAREIEDDFAACK
jgi:hypothetical protein